MWQKHFKLAWKIHPRWANRLISGGNENKKFSKNETHLNETRLIAQGDVRLQQYHKRGAHSFIQHFRWNIANIVIQMSSFLTAILTSSQTKFFLDFDVATEIFEFSRRFLVKNYLSLLRLLFCVLYLNILVFWSSSKWGSILNKFVAFLFGMYHFSILRSWYLSCNEILLLLINIQYFRNTMDEKKKKNSPFRSTMLAYPTLVHLILFGPNSKFMLTRVNEP